MTYQLSLDGSREEVKIETSGGASCADCRYVVKIKTFRTSKKDCAQTGHRLYCKQHQKDAPGFCDYWEGM